MGIRIMKTNLDKFWDKLKTYKGQFSVINREIRTNDNSCPLKVICKTKSNADSKIFKRKLKLSTAQVKRIMMAADFWLYKPLILATNKKMLRLLGLPY